MHFSLIVIGNGDLGKMMEPFWQDLDVPEYLIGEVSEMDKQRFLDFYNEHTPGYHFSSEQFDELYKVKGDDWNGNRWRKDSRGVWCEYGDYNQNAEWDWYEVGGRWPGMLKLKDGAKGLGGPNFSWGWSPEQRQKFMEMYPNYCDRAYKKDIANIDTLTAWSVLKDGEWYNTDGDEGMPVAPFLFDVADDTIITCVDYHM